MKRALIHEIVTLIKKNRNNQLFLQMLLLRAKSLDELREELSRWIR